MVPKQWGKYMTNAQNKRNLCDFFVKSWCLHGPASLEDDKELVIGGGFSDNNKAVSVKKCTCDDMVEYLVIMKKQTQGYCFMPAMLQGHLSVLSFIRLTQMWQFFVQHILRSFFVKKCGLKRVSVINFNLSLYIKSFKILGQTMCSAVLGFHALTGCESISSFCGKVKKRPWDIMLQNTSHQKALKLLGKDDKVKESTHQECEKFVCNIYTANQKAGGTVNQVRYWLFV